MLLEVPLPSLPVASHIFGILITFIYKTNMTAALASSFDQGAQERSEGKYLSNVEKA